MSIETNTFLSKWNSKLRETVYENTSVNVATTQVSNGIKRLKSMNH